VPNVADPLGGSWYVEALTDDIERRAEEVFAHLDELGAGSMLEGVLCGIEQGWFQHEIGEAAYELERKLNDGRYVVVGVNAFRDGNDDPPPDVLRIGPEAEELQLKRLEAVKQARDEDAVTVALADVRDAAADPTTNVMPALLDAVRAYATIGEIMDGLSRVFGRHREQAVI
jgi:methylmalonyl-CoA mutase, N-terminal domain